MGKIYPLFIFVVHLLSTHSLSSPVLTAIHYQILEISWSYSVTHAIIYFISNSSCIGQGTKSWSWLWKLVMFINHLHINSLLGFKIPTFASIKEEEVTHEDSSYFCYSCDYLFLLVKTFLYCAGKKDHGFWVLTMGTCNIHFRSKYVLIARVQDTNTRFNSWNLKKEKLTHEDLQLLLGWSMLCNFPSLGKNIDISWTISGDSFKLTSCVGLWAYCHLVFFFFSF